MLQQLHKDNCWLLHQLQRSQGDLEQAQRQLADQPEVGLDHQAAQPVSVAAPIITCSADRQHPAKLYTSLN